LMFKHGLFLIFRRSRFLMVSASDIAVFVRHDLVLVFQPAMLSQHAHAVHQVLQGNDADDAIAFRHRNERHAPTCHAANHRTERVAWLRYLKAARHNALHIAIAFAAQRFQNSLPRDDAYEIRSAHYGELILQAVNGLIERIFERVRWRERGEVGQHHVAHRHRVDDRLKHQSLVFQLCADKDKEAAHNEPWAEAAAQPRVGDEEQCDSAENGHRAEDLSHSRSSARSLRIASRPAEAAAGPLRILLSETEEDQPLLRVLQESADAASGIMLAVGPEGGWTAAEIALFMDAGWQSVSLGPRILRVETAVIAALAVVNAAAANPQTGSAKVSS